MLSLAEARTRALLRFVCCRNAEATTPEPHPFLASRCAQKLELELSCVQKLELGLPSDSEPVRASSLRRRSLRLPLIVAGPSLMVKVKKLKRKIQGDASLTPSENIKKKGKKNEENHPKESNPPTSSTAGVAVNSVANTSRAVENWKNKEPAVATPVEKSSGFIFMCSRKTKPECFSFQVFGLPGGKKEIVERIKTGAKLVPL